MDGDTDWDRDRDKDGNKAGDEDRDSSGDRDRDRDVWQGMSILVELQKQQTGTVGVKPSTLLAWAPWASPAPSLPPSPGPGGWPP